MDLYFSPLACSMATRIALYEAGAEANFLEVDPKTKIVQSDGSNFREVNPLGLVPTLRTDDGLTGVGYFSLLAQWAVKPFHAAIEHFVPGRTVGDIRDVPEGGAHAGALLRSFADERLPVGRAGARRVLNVQFRLIERTIYGHHSLPACRRMSPTRASRRPDLLQHRHQVVAKL